MRTSKSKRASGGLCALLVAAGSCISLTALADEPVAPPPGGAAPGMETAPPAVAASTTGAMSDSRMRVGFNLVPTPLGTYEFSGPGGSLSGDLGFAFGVLPFFDYLVTPNFFIGVGPTYTFNVKAKDATGNASKQLDLLLRLGGQAPVADTIHLYGYLAPGYSILMDSDGGDDAKGLVLGVHAGAMYTLSPTIFLNGELGYQVGFQKVSVMGTSIDAKDNLMQIALGGGVRL